MTKIDERKKVIPSVTFTDRKISLSKYIDVRGNTVTYSAQHSFWIVGDNSKFFTVACSQKSIEQSHPVETVLL